MVVYITICLCIQHCTLVYRVIVFLGGCKMLIILKLSNVCSQHSRIKKENLKIYQFPKISLEIWSLYIQYVRFGIILTPFYTNFSRQKHQIDVLYISFNSSDSQISSYTSFHFFLYSSFKKTWYLLLDGLKRRFLLHQSRNVHSNYMILSKKNFKH